MKGLNSTVSATCKICGKRISHSYKNSWLWDISNDEISRLKMYLKHMKHVKEKHPEEKTIINWPVVIKRLSWRIALDIVISLIQIVIGIPLSIIYYPIKWLHGCIGFFQD